MLEVEDWTPSYVIDWSHWESEGYIELLMQVEGIDIHDLVFCYMWMVKGELQCGTTGNTDVAAFRFIPPFDADYLVTCIFFAPDGTTKSVTGPVPVKSKFEVKPVKREVRKQDAEVTISAKNVSMVFNVASEQYNSLKEYFIALAHHEVNFKAFRALDNISFDVRRGEAFGLVGTNGSGKSTMLKIIAGVLDATEGSCTVTGTIAPLIELGAGFDMELTAKENIYLNGALLGYRKEFISERFDDIVEFAELDGFMDMPLKNYSSGMVARIAFSIATITEPDILIVDETLSVGDFLFQKKCEKRIHSLLSSGRVTVLLVSHSIDLIEGICDRVCWIEKGKLRMIGPTLDVCKEYRKLSR